MSIGNFNTENITKQTSIAMWASFSLMAILLVWAFVTPPKGDISASVLKGCAMLYAVIPSAIIREAFKEGKGAKLTHGDTHIEIDNK